jgi:GTP diphosphokinase / guanosine-3',5'-bis(diphosphate) 3'-diphosphatase
MDVLDKAIEFATNAHSGQVRKLAKTPYILHPMEVACIISTMTTDKETMAAGLLHDTIEDCNIDPQTIYDEFGKRVYGLVLSETEDKLSDRPPADTWMERKEESLLMLEMTQDEHVRILWLADKLSNIRSFYREYLVKGDEIWSTLNQKDPKMQEWYYRSIAKSLISLKDTAAYLEYISLVDRIFGEESKNGNEN